MQTKEIMFQAHVTFERITDLESFTQLCAEENVKPVLIKLPFGDHVDQPMFTANFMASSVDDAKTKTCVKIENFSKNGYKTSRIKLEISINDLLDIDCSPLSEDYIENAKYFEVHIKVNYDDLEKLTEIALKYSCYISQNDIEPNIRFLSVRKHTSYTYEKSKFVKKIMDSSGNYRSTFLGDEEKSRAFEEELSKNNIHIIKEKYECCVYDSNKNLDNHWENIDWGKLKLQASEELMIYIANNLNFIVKGSFLTKEFHKNPYDRLKNGGDIDLIYTKETDLSKDGIDEREKYYQFIKKAQRILKDEIIAILCKLDEIIINKYPELSYSDYSVATSLDKDDYETFCDNANIEWYLVNYGTEDDFSTLGLEICYYRRSINIDIAINMPINFKPISMEYKMLTDEICSLNNASPHIYQVAWKMHQILVRPRLKDLDDIIRILPHLNLSEEENLTIFITEVIKECKLSEKKVCDKLINKFKTILSFNQDRNFLLQFIRSLEVTMSQEEENNEAKYYLDLYTTYDVLILNSLVTKNFFKTLSEHIDSEKSINMVEILADM